MIFWLMNSPNNNQRCLNAKSKVTIYYCQSVMMMWLNFLRFGMPA